MPQKLHDVYCVRLNTDAFLPIETLWTIYLYDGTARVDIERPEDAIAACALPPELLAQELAFKYVVIKSQVELLEPSQSLDVPNGYSCDLFVAKANANGETSRVWFNFIPSLSQGVLAAHELMADQDQDSDAEDEDEGPEEYAFPEVVWWRAAREPVLMTLGPLTCGEYTVAGAVVEGDVESMVIPAVVHLELLPGGRLVGHSEEHDDEAGLEMIPLTGSWARSTIEFFKAYELEDGVRDVFLYRGQVSQFRFSGQWVNVNSEGVQAVTLVRSQRFDMHVTKMKRRWSPQDHSFFPDEYREAVKLCLLSSLRGGSRSLPNVLWLHVFEFCDSEWFFAQEV